MSRMSGITGKIRNNHRAHESRGGTPALFCFSVTFKTESFVSAAITPMAQKKIPQNVQ